MTLAQLALAVQVSHLPFDQNASHFLFWDESISISRNIRFFQFPHFSCALPPPPQELHQYGLSVLRAIREMSTARFPPAPRARGGYAQRSGPNGFYALPLRSWKFNNECNAAIRAQDARCGLPAPSHRTNRTRRVSPPVLNGHAVSLPPY